MNETNTTERSWKAVYTIVERQNSEKKHWVRIGNAFVNRDQSINVRLDAVPVNGQIHIRDIDEEERERSRVRREARTANGASNGAMAFGGAA
jgi:hypothetical protein